MPKIKAPLLSFQADGSIGKSITFAQTQAGQIAKSIPSHPDARTLPQLYQRWRFRDACYYWRSLSNAARQVYKDTARPLRMTGWTYFLSIYLSDPLDQVLWLRLDEKGGPTAKDHSGKGNDATIFGAIPTTGVIDGAYQSDGLDDYFNCGHAANLDNAEFTASFWVRPDHLNRPLLQTIATKDDSWYINFQTNTFQLWTTIHTGPILNSPNLTQGTTYHIAVTYDGTNLNLYINGVRVDTAPSIAPPPSPDRDLLLSVHGGALASIPPQPATYCHSMTDDFRLYTRAHSVEQIIEIATTQYWPNPVI